MSALAQIYYDALVEYRSELIKCIDVNDILGEMTTLSPNDEERIRTHLDVRGKTTQGACMELLVHIRRRGKECFFDFLLALKKNKCIEVLNKIINCANCRDDWKKYCETKISNKGEAPQTCKEYSAAEPTSIDVEKKQEPVSKDMNKGRITGEVLIVEQVTESTITSTPPQVEPQVMENAGDGTQPDVGGCQSVSLCDVEWGTLIDLVQRVEWLDLAKKFSFTWREMKEIRKSTDQVDKFVETLIDKADEKGWTLETLNSHIKDIGIQEPLKQSVQAVQDVDIEKSMQALPSYEDAVGINTSDSPGPFITGEASKGKPTAGMNISKELPVIDKRQIKKKPMEVDDNEDLKEKNLNSLSETNIQEKQTVIEGDDNEVDDNEDLKEKNLNSLSETNIQEKQTVIEGENNVIVIGAKDINVKKGVESNSTNVDNMAQRTEPVASVDFYGVGAEGLNAAETLKPEPVASVDFDEDTGEGLKAGAELEAAENLNLGENKFADKELNTGGEELQVAVQASATLDTLEPEPVASVDFYEDTGEGLKAGAALENLNLGENKFADKELNTGGEELQVAVQASATLDTLEPVASVDFYEDTGEGLKAGAELEAAENLNARDNTFSVQELNIAGEEPSTILQGTPSQKP